MNKKFTITWSPHVSIVKFNGEIDIQDIEWANTDIHGDLRTYKTLASIWDFTKCNTERIESKDLKWTMAVDLGSTKTIKTYKLAFITNDPHTLDFLTTYASDCIYHGSPWEFKTFKSWDGVDDWTNA